MMNTDREDLRLLVTEFNDGPMGCANDFAWRRHLKTYESLLAEIRQLNNIIGTFDDFMCNNWTPANVHGLWNELLTKEEEE